MKMAACHPDREHEAHGLCKTCYGRSPERLAKNRERAATWYAENIDIARARGREQYRKNKEAGRRKAREYYRKNRDAILQKLRDNPDARKDANLRQKYGISLSEWNGMLQKQRGRCSICRSSFVSTSQIHVDHCHRTERVRSLLCFNCNGMLGHARDNEETLLRGAEYIRAFNKKFCISSQKSRRKPAASVPPPALPQERSMQPARSPRSVSHTSGRRQVQTRTQRSSR